MAESPENTTARFLGLLRRALAGWQYKVDNDFSATSAARELRSLQSDPVYAQFGLASNDYVLVRLMGRMSISIGRRLGELYDNLPKYVAAARFGLEPSDVSAKVGLLNLDVCIPFAKLSSADRRLASRAALDALSSGVDLDSVHGLGIEIRYNFNPNDSARLRKDVAMAEGLVAVGLLPMYLVYSGISPRAEAIARLRRAGWHFLIAEDAVAFTRSLLGLDVGSLLSQELVQQEIEESMAKIMSAMFHSAAMQLVLEQYGAESDQSHLS